MKRKMRASVLTGILIVPTVSTHAPIDVAASVATVDADLLRLQEIQQLSEKTTNIDFAIYEQKIGEITSIKDVTSLAHVKPLLTAKVDYLKGIKSLDSLTADFKIRIGNLKATNSSLASEVEDLKKTLTQIEQAVHSLHLKLDVSVRAAKGTTHDQAFIDATLENLETYVEPKGASVTTDRIEYYKASKGIATSQKSLETYVNDLIRAAAFVKGGKIDVPTGDSGTIEIVIEGFIKDDNKPSEGLLVLGEVSALGNATAIQKFRDKVKATNSYYKENLSKSQQQIVSAYALPDKRTVGEVMKAADVDLAAADKMNKDVDAVATKSFKTGAALDKELTKHQTAYNKLNERQQVLSTSYIKLEAYDKIVAVMLQIDALKAAATKEYHEAVIKAETDYKALSTPDQAVVNNGNYAKLESAVKAITEAEAVIVKIDAIKKGIDTSTPADNVLNITAARAAYTAASATAKKIVHNYKDLQAWEKAYKAAQAIEKAIDKLAIANTKTFGTTVAATDKKYEALTDDQKKLVKNNARLLGLKPFAEATADFYNLKLIAIDYADRVSDLSDKLAALTPNPALVDAKDITALTTLHTRLTADVAEKQRQITEAKNVDQAITDAASESNLQKKFMATLEARAAYTKLGESSKDALKLVKNLKILTSLEKDVKKSIDVMKKIDAVDLEGATFTSKSKVAYSAYDKLTSTEKGYLPTTYTVKAIDFKTYLDFADMIKAIKPTAVDFQAQVVDARSKLGKLVVNSAWESHKHSTADSAALVAQIRKYDTTITLYESFVRSGSDLVSKIDQLGTLVGQKFLNEVDAIEAIYAKLSPDAKKQVTNYKQFQTMKKDGVAALRVVNLIDHDTIKTVNVTNPDYVKRFAAALKAYDSLTNAQRNYVYNYTSSLKPYIKVYEVVDAIGKLKSTSKTYLTDVAQVRALYNQLSDREKVYVSGLLPKITGAEESIAEVKQVIKLIENAKPGDPEYVQKLIAAREAYDALALIDPTYQKLVTNYKVLVEREQQMKPVTTAIYQIIELAEIIERPYFDSNDFVKKYNTAIRNYETINYESRELVYNREILFTAIYPLAKTIESIDKIAINSATFTSDVKQARAWYDSLSEGDRNRITNYDKLIAFEQTVGTGNVIDQMILDIASQPTTRYMQAIKEARAAYDALTAEQKKAVTRYKELQSYENGVKNVQAAIDAIDAMQFASNLISAYDKASKAIDKLTAEQRQMIPNISKLQSVAPAIEVYKMIEALKPTNANYTGAVQAAYAAYNTLSSGEKQYVTNFADLQDAKNSIDLVQRTISKIAAISPSSRDYAKQVEEALALYNSLPAAVKKLVTNYDTLKTSQGEVSAVDKVKQLILEINSEMPTFEEKVKAARSAYEKLTTAQKRLVGNYFLLEDYEAELSNDSFFFF